MTPPERRTAAITTDVPEAAYTSATTLRASRTTTATGTPSQPVRATVEVRLRQGGMSPRALLGARLEPADGTHLELLVDVSDQTLGIGQATTCPSSLGSHLVPGLPREFADAVLDELTNHVTGLASPAGTLHIDRAAYDEIESTPRVFRLAADLLLHTHASLGSPTATTSTVGDTK